MSTVPLNLVSRLSSIHPFIIRVQCFVLMLVFHTTIKALNALLKLTSHNRNKNNIE